MKRVVIDTNVMIVLFGRNSRFHPLIQALAAEKYSLLVSTDIMLEYEEVFYRRHSQYSALAALTFLHGASAVIEITPNYRWNLIHTDPDDNKFVDCAIAGNADAIVTEDVHFAVLNEIPFPKVSVLSVEKFAALLGVHLA